MALAVVAYPKLDPKDAEWIEAIRAEHDPLSRDIIAAHITLVFPVANVDRIEFINHVTSVAETVQPIDFVLRSAVLSGHDDEYNCTHVFFVPDEGNSRICRLHDRLYTGLLESWLRLDIPYAAHVGVANNVDPNVCKWLADTLNANAFEITGRIEWLDILHAENMRFDTLERVRLQSQAN